MIRRNRPKKAESGEAAVAAGVRLQRVLAAAGVASRRACEEMIEQGRVAVNGEVVRRLPVFVRPGEDRVEVDGRPLARDAVRAEGEGGRRGGGGGGGEGGSGPKVTAARSVYLMLYKPERVMSTTHDDGGRRTVMDLIDHPLIQGEVPVGLGGSTGRLFPVGRLDFHTSGLVLLTNDGELTHRLTHPKFGVSKTYEVLAKGDLPEADVRKLEASINKHHRQATRQAGRVSKADRPIALRVRERRGGKTLLEVELTETGERPLGDLLLEADLRVFKIVRTKLGPLELSHLPVGGWRELERDEIRTLREAAGLIRGKSGPKRGGAKSGGGGGGGGGGESRRGA
jgi:23S rRNA pseudouridine2605 synthase